MTFSSEFDAKHAVLAAIAVIALLLLGRFYVEHERDRVAMLSSMSTTVENQNKLIADINERLKSTEANRQAAKDELDKQRRGAVTPEQIAALISQAAGLRQPIEVKLPDVKTPSATGDAMHNAATGSTFPNAPQPELVLQKDAANQLADFVTSCKKCQVDSTALENEKQDLNRKITSITAERDAAIMSWRRRHRGKIHVFEDRRLEITSMALIDVEEQIGRVERALRRAA